MKGMNCWYICGALFIALLLVAGSASRALPIALPVATLIGLGLPAVALLVEHRAKMIEILDIQLENSNHASF